MDDTATIELDAKPDEADIAGFEWCVVEVFGHRSHAGRAREEERFGSKMMRIDALRLDDDGADVWQTFYYPGSAIFSYQPSKEDVVRQRAPRSYPARRAPALAAQTCDCGRLQGQCAKGDLDRCPALDDDGEDNDDRDYEHG